MEQHDSLPTKLKYLEAICSTPLRFRMIYPFGCFRPVADGTYAGPTLVNVVDIARSAKNLFDFSFIGVIVQKDVSSIMAIKPPPRHETLILRAGNIKGLGLEI